MAVKCVGEGEDFGEQQEATGKSRFSSRLSSKGTCGWDFL